MHVIHCMVFDLDSDYTQHIIRVNDELTSLQEARCY